jgi:hypothetical protein
MYLQIIGEWKDCIDNANFASCTVDRYFSGNISLTLTKIKLTIHMDQRQGSEFNSPPYD